MCRSSFLSIQIFIYFIAGDLDMAKYLIENEDASVDYVRKTNTSSPIFSEGFLNLLIEIIYAGDFPLAVACRYGNVELVKWLLDNHANINATTKDGKTVLHLVK
jgi:ankyrin repeat protein